MLLRNIVIFLEATLGTFIENPSRWAVLPLNLSELKGDRFLKIPPKFETLSLTYRDALNGSSQVVGNWMNKLRFVSLLQAGGRNFSTPYSHNLGRAF